MPNPKPSDTQPEVRELLFKEDRPRPIDRYIDFFGTGDDQRAADPFRDGRQR